MALTAAYQYLRATYGGDFESLESSVATGAAAAVVVDNTPEAVALTIVNLGANPVYLGVSDSVSATQGLSLAASGGYVSMSVRDDATLPTRRWWGVSPGGPSTLYVLTVRRYALVAP